MGLYDGLDVDDIHTKKGLEVGQKILDYVGSTELVHGTMKRNGV